MVGNLVSFDVTATATATVLLLALGVGLARRSESRTEVTDAPQRQAAGAPRMHLGPARRARDQTTSDAWAGLAARAGPAVAPRRLAVLPLLLMIMAGVSGAVWQANVRPIAADMAARGRNSTPRPRTGGALDVRPSGQ